MPKQVRTVAKAKARRRSKSTALGGTRAVAVATDKKKPAEERLEALALVPLAVGGKDENLRAVIETLRDANEAVEVRMAALQSLQAASFRVEAFEPVRGDYRAALRKIATDANPELRQRALELLAQEKEGFAQKKLLEGLQDPDKALVPPEKALQLLSYDVHADAYKHARRIVENPPNPLAKREALRLLAADPSAIPTFEKVLLDKNELRENRQLAASALHAADPTKMQALARNIVVDSGDYDDIRATSLTALTQFGDKAAVAADQALQQSVDRMKVQGSQKLRDSATRFLDTYKT